MRFYIVQTGDTLSSIALRYNTTVAELIRLNNIVDPDLIYPGQVIALPTTSPCPPLHRGDCDANTAGAVSELQALLNTKFNAGLVVDGLFEALTEKAVKSFQTSRVINPTGIVNLATWTALGINCMPAPTATPTPTPTSTVLPTSTIIPPTTCIPTLCPTGTPLPTNTPLPTIIPTITPTPTPTGTPVPTVVPPLPTLESTWFYVSSPNAWSSLQAHYQLINILIPFWYGITSDGEIIDNTEEQVLNFAKSKAIPVYGLIHNIQGGRFNPELIRDILKDPGLRTRLVSNILELITRRGLAGVNIDFEFIPPDQRNNLTLFMSELYQTLHGAGYGVTIDVPAKVRDEPLNSYSGAFDYANLAKYADEVILLTQDEHYLAYPVPGPIASIPYDRSVLNYAVTQIPPSKIKLTIPVYGYDWPLDSTGTTVSGADAILLAQTTGAPILFDPVNLVPHFNYTTNNVPHQVWFENDVSFAIKVDLAREYKLGGFAVWRLGLEESGVWDVLDTYM